jgi:hypothetical protein
MGFFMQYCKKIAKIFFKCLAVCYLSFNTLYCSAINTNASIKKFELENVNGNFYASVISDISIDNDLRDAIDKGLPVTFILQSKVSISRWYWFDNTVSENEYKWVITYRPFLNKYKISTKTGVSLYFDNLSEALDLIKSLKKWEIIDSTYSNDIKSSKYNVSLRLHLDTNRLPKLMQLNTISNKKINIDSGWQEYTISP